MFLPFLSPSRSVLLVSDEALYIYATGARGARLVETVPWDAENFEANVGHIIAKDCKSAPILILNDMVEQHYRKERVLRAGVGPLDRGGMLKRKLNFAFPNYPVRAALPLKEKLVEDEKKQAADIYIFAAVPETTQFIKTIEAAARSLAPLSGYCLLPVEAADMVKALSEKLSKKNANKSKWTIFMGQHKNGGLRQIVTRDGELALTRMTPIVENDNDTEMWVSDVYQEFKATMSYLSRFGFQPEDGLNLIVIANSSSGEALEVAISEQCNFYTLTASDAARHLGINIGVQDEFRFADPLHVAWIGRKTRFVLPMKSKRIDQVAQPRMMYKAASVLLLLSAVFFSYHLLTEFKTTASLKENLEDFRKKQIQLDGQYQREIKRKEALGFDIRLLQSSLAVYNKMEMERIKSLALFKRIGHALGQSLRLDRIELTKIESSEIASFLRRGDKGAPLFKTKLQMTYPSSADIDAGNQEVKDLRDRLEKKLPEHDVKITKLLKDYEYVEEIVVETGDLNKKDVQQDFVVEIVIRGPLIDD